MKEDRPQKTKAEVGKELSDALLQYLDGPRTEQDMNAAVDRFGEIVDANRDWFPSPHPNELNT